ncbi:MAG TPA: thiamine-phosphate kinase, partial [Burkholderiales bacterium]|nr:thiamine-phosphate kinase [Burkholderiales bacterium]
EDPTVRACALAGGDDYELCFTAPPHSSEQIARISVQCGLPLTAIGRVEPGAGVEVRDGSGEAIVLARAGFDHFSDADG